MGEGAGHTDLMMRSIPASQAGVVKALTCNPIIARWEVGPGKSLESLKPCLRQEEQTQQETPCLKNRVDASCGEAEAGEPL